MIRFCAVGATWFYAVVLMALSVPAASQDRGRTSQPAGLPQSILSPFSPKNESIDAQLAAIDQQLAALPRAKSDNTSAALGIHSERLDRPDRPFWFIVDLQQTVEIDTIVLVPAHGHVADIPPEGYGFPVRFRVDIAADASFTEARTVADHTGYDYPSPRQYPVLLNVPRQKARYVRLSVTSNWQRFPNMWLTALAEIFVFSGSRNVALHKPVRCNRPARGTRWSPEFLVDGFTPLGLPEGVRKSPSSGYQSRAVAVRDHPTWVQVDLERRVPVGEVRLVPVSNYGFSLRFQLQLANAPSFEDAVTVGDFSAAAFPSPGRNPVIVDAGGRLARYIRLVALELYPSGKGQYVVALAEMDVISAGVSVSRGRPVLSSDVPSPAPPTPTTRPVWSLRHLTDGYTSDHDLLPADVWLRQLSTRQTLESLRLALEDQRQRHVERSLSFLRWFISALAVVAVLAGLSIWFVGWRSRQKQLRAIRDQIARDLHDEVGSNLAAIVQISSAAEAETRDLNTQVDFDQIRQVASDTSEALRDLVWTLHNSDLSVENLAS